MNPHTGQEVREDREDREEQALSETRALLRNLALAVRFVFVMILPWFVRGVCVAIAIGGTVLAWPSIWQGYGGGLPGAIPATLFAFVPFVVLPGARLGIGGFPVAGIVAYLISLIVAFSPPVVRDLIVIVVVCVLAYVLTVGARKTVEANEANEASEGEQYGNP